MGCVKSKLDAHMLKPSRSVGNRFEDVVDTCRQLPFFVGLEDTQLRKASMCFEIETFTRNETIFDIGDAADKLYVIAEGLVRVSAVDSRGTTKVLCTKLSPEYFGEVALLHDCSRTAKVAAVEDSTLLSLHKRKYQQFLRLPWMACLASWLEQTASHIMTSFLRQIPFLRSLQSSQLALLGKLFRYVEYQQNDVICQEGDEGNIFYILSQGKALVCIEGEEGVQVPVQVMRPGGFFGEMALVNNAPRAATVTATRRCLLFSLHKSEFHRFLTVAPEAKASLEQMIAHRSTANLSNLKIPFFSGLSPKKMMMLAQVCEMKEFPPKTVVFKEGDKEDHTFYIITHGQVMISVAGAIRSYLGPGNYFGEVALVADVPRTATVTTHNTRTICLVIGHDDFMAIFANQPEALAEIEFKVLQDQCTLKNVLRHPTARKFFVRQLEKEFSQENIEFWLEADKFYRVYTWGARGRAKDTIARDIQASADFIYQQFICNDAPKQVNIKSASQKLLTSRITEHKVDAHMFREAQNEIYNLMEADNFARFKKSELFAKLLDAVQAYTGNNMRASQMRVQRTTTLAGPMDAPNFYYSSATSPTGLASAQAHYRQSSLNWNQSHNGAGRLTQLSSHSHVSSMSGSMSGSLEGIPSASITPNDLPNPLHVLAESETNLK